jgi:hypothetical protein
VGSRTPPPISTDGTGSGSLFHIQAISMMTARSPQITASVTNFTVRIRKNAAVNTAARTGVQPGPGRRTTYCGVASIGDVTMVSRRPVTAPGR